MYRKLQCVCGCKRCKACIYVVHKNSRASFICIDIIYNKVYAYHWLASISIDWEQRKFEIMPRPFNANLDTREHVNCWVYLFYLYSTKEMKIKADVTISTIRGKCSLNCPPPRFCRVSLCKMSLAKSGETTRRMGFWHFAAW